MIIGLAILILVTLITTVLLARRARAEGRMAPLWSIVTINGIGVAMTMMVIGFGWYFVKQYQYDRCVSTANARIDNRRQHIALYDVIDAATHSTKFTSLALIPGQPSLRDGLDKNLPPLDPGECSKP